MPEHRIGSREEWQAAREELAQLAPYFSSLLDRTPKAQPPEPRSWRKDEYPG